MQANQQNSPLLRLPAELRQMVYKFALDINSVTAPRVNLRNDDLERSPIDFCRASRQLFAETSKDYSDQRFIIYFMQTHVYGDVAELERHITNLGHDQPQVFRQVMFNGTAMVQLWRRMDDSCPLLHFSNLRMILPKLQARDADMRNIEWIQFYSLVGFVRRRLGRPVEGLVHSEFEESAASHESGREY